MRNGLILGFFDGVHIAHQAVIKSAVDFVQTPILVTFKDSPAKYFQQKCEYIYSRNKSVEKIKSFGVKEVVELDFAEIADMDAGDYLKFLIEKFNPVSISTGFNHTFGKNKYGSPKLLASESEKYGYRYFCVEPQIFNGEIVSSTLIKNFLKNGKIETANKLLGSNFSLKGEVIHGAEIGRTIGFPTANINYPENIVRIPFGVYAAKFSGRYAVLNWGMKPTVHNTNKPVLEVHVLNFEGNLYGETLEIEILKKLRDERKFSSLDELKAQINKDAEECLKL